MCALTVQGVGSGRIGRKAWPQSRGEMPRRAAGVPQARSRSKDRVVLSAQRSTREQAPVLPARDKN